MTFENIVGHEKEINILRNAISGGKVAHSFLFSGPLGVGKKLTALAFAGALNCRDFDGDACGACPDCRMMEVGNHPNLMLVCPTDKDGNEAPEGLIRIDRIREIQNALRFKADGKKVVIVDGADRMQPGAANAFLKTLEEPPEGSVIILVSAHATELLPTILSRCQKINFRPLSDGMIAAFLAEQKGFDREEARMIARQSCGSIPAALEFALGGADGEGKEFIRRLVRLAPGDTYGALELAEELSKRNDLERILESIKIWYRDLAVSSLGQSRLAVNAEAAGARCAGTFQALWDCFSLVEDARRDITPPRYANKQLTMEALVLSLIERDAPRI